MAFSANLTYAYILKRISLSLRNSTLHTRNVIITIRMSSFQKALFTPVTVGQKMANVDK
jgi:hypothetical protein